ADRSRHLIQDSDVELWQGGDHLRPGRKKIPSPERVLGSEQDGGVVVGNAVIEKRQDTQAILRADPQAKEGTKIALRDLYKIRIDAARGADGFQPHTDHVGVLEEICLSLFRFVAGKNLFAEFVIRQYRNRKRRSDTQRFPIIRKLRSVR